MTWIHRVVAALALVTVPACGDKPTHEAPVNAPAKTPIEPPVNVAGGQTPKEALELLCDVSARSDAKIMNPAERERTMSLWIGEHVKNAEVRALFATFGELSPRQRIPGFEKLLAAHGVPTCALLAELKSPSVFVPVITAGALAPPPPDAATVSITTTGVILEGTAIVAVRDGAIDPSDLDAGVIPRLVTFAEALKLPADAHVLLAVEPEASYRVLTTVVASLVRARVQHLALLMRKQGVVGVVPLRIPDRRPGADLGSLDTMPVKPVVSIAKDRLVLFSISGREGTLSKPKLTLALAPLDLAPLSRALEDIVARGPTNRTAEDRIALAQFDPATTMQTVAAVLAVIRATDKGVELFPDVMLGTGFK